MPKYDPQSQYRINAPNIVGEKFDEEVVLVNLDSGIYYSLRENAAKIWQLLTLGYSLAQMTDLIQMHSSEAPNSIAIMLGNFVDQLIEQDLLVPANLPLIEVEESFFNAAKSFAAPTLEIFADMQDILLLDPVHDVDEQGWPIHTKNLNN